VADHQQGQGAAQQLMGALVDHARGAGLHAMDGEVMDGNARMQAFATRLGFAVEHGAGCDAGVSRWTLPLQPAAREEAAAAQPAQGAHPLQAMHALRGWWRTTFQGARA